MSWTSVVHDPRTESHVVKNAPPTPLTCVNHTLPNLENGLEMAINS